MCQLKFFNWNITCPSLSDYSYCHLIRIKYHSGYTCSFYSIHQKKNKKTNKNVLKMY